MLRVLSSHNPLLRLRHSRILALPLSVRNIATGMLLPRDIREFLEGYPGLPDDPRLNANLEFYSNRRRCRPDNLLIDELHEQ